MCFATGHILVLRWTNINVWFHLQALEVFGHVGQRAEDIMYISWLMMVSNNTPFRAYKQFHDMLNDSFDSPSRV